MNTTRHPIRVLGMAVLCLAFSALPTLADSAKQPARQMERLDRGLIAVPIKDGGAYIGWRMFGYEPDTIAFNLYRESDGKTVKLNDSPLTDSTNFVDKHAVAGATYTVRPVVNGKEGVAAQVQLESPDTWPGYWSIPLDTPEGYHPNDASVGDLNGDGQYDLVLMQLGRAHDNSHSGETDPPILQAYTLDGKKLWEINLGKNIRAGAHYTQFQVYDYDGDGRAELICKTADGTTDGEGRVLGDPNADYRNDSGRILRGPEYLTLFDGLTGKALDTVPYTPQRFPDNDNPTGDQMKRFWGDGYGNRMDRFLAATAYLDGRHPSAIFSRGYYTRTFIVAYDVRNKKLVRRWVFDSEDPKCIGDHPQATDGRKYRGSIYSGQGFHNLSIADVDGDGRDEIVFGAMVVDDNGHGLYSTGSGHGDALHVGDLDPDNPGLEVFGIQERFDDAGAYMYDGKTGRILWKKPSVKAATSGGDKGEGPGRGVCFNVDPRYPGSESWAAGAGMTGVWDAKGNRIGEVKPGSCNFRIYWDADMLDELLDRNHIDKWDWQNQKTVRLFTAKGCRSNNGTKATPTLSADLFGDWREEVIFPTDDDQQLRIFTTTIPTKHRLRTLMHDPQYRLSIAWQNTAYNQPPHVSFYTDPDMPTPTAQPITMAGSTR